MDNEALKTYIGAWNDQIEFSEEGSEFLNVFIPKDDFLKTLIQLKEDPKLTFNYMFCLTCIDWPEHFQMVYHLKSTEEGHQIVVKVNLTDKEKPEIDSCCMHYRTAEFHEREVFDLFGIHFKDHPDLRRLLLTDDWKGFPLRKDYEDDINMISLK